MLTKNKNKSLNLFIYILKKYINKASKVFANYIYRNLKKVHRKIKQKAF